MVDETDLPPGAPAPGTAAQSSPRYTPRIRPYEESDWPRLWPLLRDTIAGGNTYAYAPGLSEMETHKAWVQNPRATFVAEGEHGEILGSYYIKPNQPGLGAHVSNCGFVSAPAAQGRGIATAMCIHSQDAARGMGFRAMQFNLVVSTNERAVRLWQHLGFAIAGRLPGAFAHTTLGDVDALVMYKRLV